MSNNSHSSSVSVSNCQESKKQRKKEPYVGTLVCCMISFALFGLYMSSRHFVGLCSCDYWFVLHRHIRLNMVSMATTGSICREQL